MRLLGFDGFEARGAGWGWNVAARENWDLGANLVGDDGVEEQNPGADTIGNTTGTAGSITVDGASQNGYVNTVGDDDWYAVTLVAGQSYTFTLNGGTLPDAYLELYNSGGGLIGFDDDFGSGINALLRWTATTSGTYYINAQGFDGTPNNTGSYTLTAVTSAPASPLDSIDFHFTMPTLNIAIWFATSGHVNPSGDTAMRNWTQTEIDAAFVALATFSAITPLTFTQAGTQGAANWVLSLVDIPGNTLGYFSPQNNGYGAFDPTVAGWSTGLVPGGNSFVTLIHEFGHGLGLAHPHDNGSFNYGTFNSEVMQGVTGPFGSSGTFGMNSGLYTTMTYNDNAQSTPMGLDVALLQQRYSVNPNTGSGDTGYAMSLSSSSYRCIWDVSGTDTISYSGGNNATIDLRAATLLNAVGGGGYVSSVVGVLGGFTIANGVLIENATGGSGSDTLIGNDAANILTGGAGADNMSGNGGDDTFFVDNGGDVTSDSVGGGVDTVFASATHQIGANIENLTLTGSTFINGTGNASDNVLTGNSVPNALSGLGGNDTLIGNDGNDALNGGDGNDFLDGGLGADGNLGGDGNDVFIVDNAGDTVTESASQGTDSVQAGVNYTLGANIENLTLTGAAATGAGNTLANVITGNTLANTLDGGDGNDTLNGGDGDDTLNGGLDIDTVNGGNGNDTFVYAIGDGNGAINGGADADTLSLSDGAAGAILNANYDGAALTALSGNGLSSVETINANMGGGVDWLIYSATAAVTVNLALGTASGFTSISNIERVVGGSGNDSLTGDGLDNRLDGGVGDDVLAGAGGVDTLIGGDGADSLAGGLGNNSLQGNAGNDTFSWAVGDGRDTIDGGGDADTFNAAGTAGVELGNATWNGTSLTALMDNGLANLEAVNLDLGGAIDWLIYNTTFAVTVNLATSSASGFASVANIEKVIGGAGDDTLTGDGLDNRLDGQGGGDTLDGGAGSDTVLGGDGDDIIYASANNNSLQGQNGNDAFIWVATDGRDTFNGGADSDTVNLTGSAVADVADANWNGSTITGLLNNALIDIETVNMDLGAGGAGGDWLRYNTTFGVTVNLATGTGTGFASITGVENLIGGTGNDSLTGDGSANKINGNNGDDVITGGGGADNLTGGAGNDTFVYAAGAGNDTIVDFDAWAVGGQDFLDVAAFGINAGNFATRVVIIDTGADTVIRIDDTYFITLKNVSGDGDNVITQSDFIFGP